MIDSGYDVGLKAGGIEAGGIEADGIDVNISIFTLFSRSWIGLGLIKKTLYKYYAVFRCFSLI